MYAHVVSLRTRSCRIELAKGFVGLIESAIRLHRVVAEHLRCSRSLPEGAAIPDSTWLTRAVKAKANLEVVTETRGYPQVCCEDPEACPWARLDKFTARIFITAICAQMMESFGAFARLS